MEIVVFGAGSLGSALGGALARTHDVTLVGRNPHVSAIREDGLRVEGKIEAHVHPDVTTDGLNLTADLAVVTVKTFDTAAAARDLATGEFDAAVSLQNGMGNEATLAEHLACPVLAGTTTYGAVLREPGRVECTGADEIALGDREGGVSEAAERTGQAFRSADLATTVADDMPRRLWEKLAVNAGINAVTALARIENGALLDGPANDLGTAAARETARIARACDVDLTDREATASLEEVADATAANESSMRQDLESGRRTEVDAINGYVIDRADELRAGRASTPDDPYALDAPVNRTLTRLLRAWERGRGLREG